MTEQRATGEGAQVAEEQVVWMEDEAFGIIAREEAERIIREASSETLVGTALVTADDNFDGAAVLDLTTGEIVCVSMGRSGESVVLWNTQVLLFGVEALDFSGFSPWTVGDILGEDEARKVAAARGYEDADEITKEDAAAYLAAHTDETYDSRFRDAYMSEHGEDAPEGDDLLASVREQIDVIYGL